MPMFLMVAGSSPTLENKAVVTETIYSLRHYFHYPSTVCIMAYGAVKKFNPVILRLRKEKSTAPLKTANDPHAANKVLLFKVVVNSSYGELYNKNDPLKIKCVRTVDKALIDKNQI